MADASSGILIDVKLRTGSSKAEIKKLSSTITTEMGKAEQRMLAMSARMSVTTARVFSSANKLVSTITVPLKRMAVMTGGAIAAMLKQGAEFEFQAARLKAISGASADELAKLEVVARELGATTMFTASQSIEAAQALASMGLEASEVSASLEHVIKLAGSMGGDISTTSMGLATVLNAYNMAASEAEHITDVFSHTIKNSLFPTLDTYVRAMTEGAAAGGAFSDTLEETSASIAALRNAGLRAQRSGMALKRLFTALAIETPKLNKVLQKYDMTLEQINPQMNSSAQILHTLADAGVEAGDILALTGGRFGSFIASVVGGIREGRVDVLGFAEELRGVANVVTEDYASMMVTVHGWTRAMVSALQEFGLSIFDNLKGKLATQLESFTEKLRTLSRDTGLTQQIADGLSDIGQAALTTGKQFAEAAVHIAKFVSRWPKTIAAVAIGAGPAANFGQFLANSVALTVQWKMLHSVTKSTGLAFKSLFGASQAAVLTGSLHKATSLTGMLGTLLKNVHNVFLGLSVASKAFVISIAGIGIAIAGLSGFTLGNLLRRLDGVDDYFTKLFGRIIKGFQTTREVSKSSIFAGFMAGLDATIGPLREWIFGFNELDTELQTLGLHGENLIEFSKDMDKLDKVTFDNAKKGTQDYMAALDALAPALSKVARASTVGADFSNRGILEKSLKNAESVIDVYLENIESATPEVTKALTKSLDVALQRAAQNANTDIIKEEFASKFGQSISEAFSSVDKTDVAAIDAAIKLMEGYKRDNIEGSREKAEKAISHLTESRAKIIKDMTSDYKEQENSVIEMVKFLEDSRLGDNAIVATDEQLVNARDALKELEVISNNVMLNAADPKALEEGIKKAKELLAGIMDMGELKFDSKESTKELRENIEKVFKEDYGSMLADAIKTGLKENSFSSFKTALYENAREGLAEAIKATLQEKIKSKLNFDKDDTFEELAEKVNKMLKEGIESGDLRKWLENAMAVDEPLRLQFATDTLTKGIAEAMVDAIHTGDFQSFEQALYKAVYDEVKRGIVEAMIASEKLAPAIKMVIDLGKKVASGEMKEWEAEAALESAMDDLGDVMSDFAGKMDWVNRVFGMKEQRYNKDINEMGISGSTKMKHMAEEGAKTTEAVKENTVATKASASKISYATKEAAKQATNSFATSVAQAGVSWSSQLMAANSQMNQNLMGRTQNDWDKMWGAKNIATRANDPGFKSGNLFASGRNPLAWNSSETQSVVSGVKRLADQGDYASKMLLKVADGNNYMARSLNKFAGRNVEKLAVAANAIQIMGRQINQARTEMGYDINALVQMATRKEAYDSLIASNTSAIASNTGNTYSALTHKGTVYMSMIDAEDKALRKLSGENRRVASLTGDVDPVPSGPFINKGAASRRGSGGESTVVMHFPNMITGDRESIRKLATVVTPEINDSNKKGQVRNTTTAIPFR